MSYDKIVQFKLTKVYLNVKTNEIVAANEVPVSLLGALRDLCLGCVIEHTDGLGECCRTTDVRNKKVCCSICETKNKKCVTACSWLYYHRCFGGISQIYKSYNEAFQTIIHKINELRADEITKQEMKEHTNQAFKLTVTDANLLIKGGTSVQNFDNEIEKDSKWWIIGDIDVADDKIDEMDLTVEPPEETPETFEPQEETTAIDCMNEPVEPTGEGRVDLIIWK
ncbi:unnamed protein product [Mytilus edulis]|uniref:Uncharacterized protein n=1 Tax=Mytilus edulis TaxID=6550 RepID=A0A8S3R0C0_MYTED|nr:unnamed protein product [Mytilus edulis]